MGRFRPTPGDIFAVPRKDGGFRFIAHLTLNRFGHAFGMLQGSYEFRSLPERWNPIPVGYPVYTGATLVRSGKWHLIGKAKEVLALFPQKIEIFHRKTDNLADPKIGPFGSGETSESELRNLSEGEAYDIDLGNTYRQIMLEEQFEDHLERTIGR